MSNTGKFIDRSNFLKEVYSIKISVEKHQLHQENLQIYVLDKTFIFEYIFSLSSPKLQHQTK